MMRQRWRQAVVMLAVTVVYCMVPAQLGATEKGEPVVIGEIIHIQSDILGEERPLWVYVPGNYSVSRDSYPVLYLLDGGSHFHHVTGLVDFLSRRARIPPLIVVAVPNTDRNRDFLPTRVDQFPPTAGADKFLTFLKDELLPFVDRQYRTVPYRILVGHSYGGLFSIYSFLNSPELFNAYFVVSPSVYWDDRLMFKKAEGFFQKNRHLEKFIFLTTAGEDKEAIRSASRDFARLLDKIAPEGVARHFRFMAEEDHNSTVHRTIYLALESLYPDWHIPRKQLADMPLPEIQEHFRKLSGRYGYPIQAPESTVDLKGFLLHRENKIEEAVAVLKSNVEHYPESVGAHLRLARIYEATGELDLAKKSLETAVKLAEKNQSPYLSLIKQRLSTLLEKIKSTKTKDR